ncbi:MULTISPECIES: hypothetical protein [Pseudonocardia]|uniref:Uncharacterized protein n=1 Tax=Pseudonocardia oroxyli TaxID=366584 RepID=A0A1G7HQL9_PSEOR|nr:MULTISPECIES: hypothetical protein [Pseudonocardia]MCF7549023.1 hypothetical protein [Pseudonocardia sp. WMMC193]SDF02745.1 hypothetical protein SAMN05216377_10390 [Pseudonocardia oroxyli]
MSMPTAAELTRARTARRGVAVMLVLAGVTACLLALFDVAGGSGLRLAVTIGFLLLGPGWAAAGFLRRAPAAHMWLLTLGVGIATTLLAAQIMVSATWWHPDLMLYIVTGLSVPFLLRHAVVAQ